MKRRSFLCSSGALLAQSGMAASKQSNAGRVQHGRIHTPSLMSESARRFLAALDANQRDRATIAFDAAERMNWNYVPNERRGLALLDMAPHQKHLAGALLAAGLSQTGYIKAVTIMSLEDVLRLIENDTGERRNPDKYYFSVFGTPSDEAVWGYRIEGHHLSQNYTMVDGKVICGPSFFGANPAEVTQGPRKGLRTLAREDDLGIELVNALDEESRKIAIVDPAAYADILTAASRRAALHGQPSGLAAAKMDPGQFDVLRALMEEYARNVPGELAEGRLAQIDDARREIHFAWAGGTHRGDPHYYRVQTSSFLIEFDDTQNNANHIHSVWRDFGDDFGEDMLKQHYHASHQRPP